MLDDGEDNARGGFHVTASQSAPGRPETVLRFAASTTCPTKTVSLFPIPSVSSPLRTFAYADAGDGGR